MPCLSSVHVISRSGSIVAIAVAFLNDGSFAKYSAPRGAVAPPLPFRGYRALSCVSCSEFPATANNLVRPPGGCLYLFSSSFAFATAGAITFSPRLASNSSASRYSTVLSTQPYLPRRSANMPYSICPVRSSG